MKKNLFVTGILCLLMFQSCNNTNDSLIDQEHAKVGNQSSINQSISDSKSLSLSGFIANQILIETKIKDLLDNESKVNYSEIQLGLDKIKTIEELQSLLKNANISEAEQLISLYQQLGSNTEKFINSNPEFYSKYSEEERQNLLITEIDSQLGYDEVLGITAKTNCHANFVKASNRCMKKFVMETGLAVVGGIFTGGTTAVLGGAAATIGLVMCNADADEDYHDCVHEGGQP
jgi:hypothetical protein